MDQTSPPLKRNWILAALMLTIFLAAMDIAIVSTVIPEIVRDIGGFKKFSWVFSIYLLTQTATIPLYGKLSDLYGRKKILLFGIVVFLIGSAACASAWSIDSLIIFRGLQGIGGGSIMATVNTIAGDIYTVKERAKIQGWLSSIWGVSAILGPVIGGSLAEFFNWRWIFLINLPVGILAILFLSVYFKERVVKQKVNIDYGGAITIFCMLACLIAFLLNGNQAWAWISWQSISLFIGTGVFLLLAIFIERRAKSPIMPGWVLTHRTFLGSNLAVVGLGITMMGPTTYLPTFMQASLGFGVILSGLVLAANSIGWPTASALSGKLYLRIGFRNTELIGVVLFILTSLAYLFVPWPQPIYALVFTMIFLGAGFGLLSTPTLVGIQSVVNWDKRGVVTGANQFGRYLGQSLGAAIFGAVFNGSYTAELEKAKLKLPDQGENIIETLNSAGLTEETKNFIRETLNTANDRIFMAMVFFGILALFAVMLVPKKLQLIDG